VGRVSVEIPVPADVKVTVDGDRLGTKPADEMVADNVITPVKPLRLVRVIVEVAEEPCVIVRFRGNAEMEKSGGCD